MSRPLDYEAAALHGALWTPAAARPSIRLWLDSDRLDTLTLSSGRVSQWDDVSGRGLHASQGTAGQRPLWNGQGAGITFLNSRTDLLSGSALWGPSTLGEFAVVYVATTDAIVDAEAFSLSGSRLASGRVIAYAPYTDGNTYWDCGSASAPERVSGAWGGSTGVPNVWTFVSSASRSAQYIARNGSTLASDSSGTSVTSIGVYEVGRQMSYTMFEFIFCDLTDDWFVRLVEGYLYHKWRRYLPSADMAAGHPYRNAPPLTGG